MWWWHGNLGWGGWLVMSLGMLAFWALVIWLFVSVLRTSPDTPPRQATPEETLADRFARGEIDDDEYRQRLETLHGSHGGRTTPKANA